MSLKPPVDPNTPQPTGATIAPTTIYCSPTGTGDGRSVSSPTTLARAAASLAGYVSPLRGKWTIQLAAGTYPGVTFPRAIRTCDDYLYIVGPNVGHPNEPTAIIDYASDTSKTKGISVFDFMQVWVKDIETKNFPTSGLDAERHCTVQISNHWDRGSGSGRRFVNQVAYFASGGYLIGNTFGVNELFGITRDYSSAGSVGAGTVIQNAGIGVIAKENTRGHMDYLTVEDSDVGIEFHAYTTANVGNLQLKRNDVGVVLVNSEIHESGGIDWGTGADACTNRILSLGDSSEIDRFGWDGSVPVTLRDGHRPMVTVGSNYSSTTFTGFSVETLLFSHTYEQAEFTMKGQRRKLTAWGTINTVASGQYRFILRAGGGLGCELDIPNGSTGSFYIEAEMLTTSDGNHQTWCARLIGEGYTDLAITPRTTTMDDADHSLGIYSIPAANTDSITLKVREAWG